MRPLFAARFACSALAAVAADPPPARPADGWTDLLKAGPDSPWKKVDPGWIVAEKVGLDPEKASRLKAEKKDGGTVWVNGEKGRLPDLLTKQDFGDCEAHVEFLIAKNSNSGAKLQGVYEIQIRLP